MQKVQKVLNVAFSMTENDGVCTQSIIDQAIDDILHENERNYKNRLSLLIGTPFFFAEREGFASAINLRVSFETDSVEIRAPVRGCEKALSF